MLSNSKRTLGHDSDTLGVDSAEVGVLEESNEVCLSSLLESENCRALESEVSLELLSNLANQALEWELANEELSRLLVSPDFSEGDSAWAISVGLLHASSGWGILAGCLGGELLTRGPEGRRVEKRRKGLGGFEARRKQQTESRTNGLFAKTDFQPRSRVPK